MNLFDWTPPRQIIPFPSRLRQGHARKVAVLLAKARTSREADHVLSKAVQAHSRQMLAAGIDAAEIERQRLDYLATIHVECERVDANWLPCVPARSGSDNPRGAA